jgi:acetyl-CoA synthetase
MTVVGKASGNSTAECGFLTNSQGSHWVIPQHFNMGVSVCDKWADGSGRVALICEDKDGEVKTYTFDQLKVLSNKFASALTRSGVRKGDRIGIYLQQGVETALAHIAAYKIGAITVPLFYLFGPDAIGYRLHDSGANVLVTDSVGLQKAGAIRGDLPDLKHMFVTDPIAGMEQDAHAFWDAIQGGNDNLEPVETLADDPALIIYTSGTTGKPKGALHAHRVLLGHLPGVQVSHDAFPQPGDLFWTPADWAWIGGLLDVLLPSLFHGIPVLARRLEKFDADTVYGLLARHQVRNVFFPPTALKLLRSADAPGNKWPFRLRSVASGGEPLGKDLVKWGQEVLGVTINEFYGQTECNLVVSSSSTMFATREGSMGRAVPGHHVAVVDDQGAPVPAGTIGNIAIRSPDPVMFLEYWKNPDATREKFAGDYLLTGDLGKCDDQGYFTYLGRNDDVITSAGYRIGPGPIEECLMRHRAVKLAAVVGVKDPVRTEIVKAFIVLKEGYVPSSELTAEIQEFVRSQLAAHEYPRAVAYVETLPTTPTGKIMRRILKNTDESLDGMRQGG